MQPAFTPIVLLHTLAAFAAIVLGAGMFLAHKGTFGHRVAGRAWVGLMLVTAISSFWIARSGSFSWIHALSVVVILMLAAAVYYAIAHNVRGHRRMVTGLYAGGLLLTVFGATVALALGPFQFLSRLRDKHIRLHRWMGRLYLGVGVLAGGVAGLYVSQFAYGGPLGQLGFGALALAWLYTGARAFDAIRRREIAAHRRWMVRNFALAYAAVMLRLYLPASMALGADFYLAYGIIAWACWLPNLFFAEWLLRARTA